MSDIIANCQTCDWTTKASSQGQIKAAAVGHVYRTGHLDIELPESDHDV